MPNSSGGMFVMHRFHLLFMAREPVRTALLQSAQHGTKPYFAESLVVIVFTARSVGTFINELTEIAGREVDSSDQWRARPAEVQVLADLAAAL